ncbi:MAG: hypothetical protein ACT4PZ_03290 [Panacagrimonas sp.]
MKPRVVAFALLAVSSSAQAADFSECVNIGDDVVRLFCYDRAAGRQAAPIAAPAAAADVRKADTEAKTETEPEAKPKNRVEARILGKFEGWSKGTRFKLDNGQTWEAVGAGTYYSVSESPAVVIERDFFGQHLMSVEGIKSKAIVSRVETP